MPLTVVREGHRELIRLLNQIIEAAGPGAVADTLANARKAMAQEVARQLANKNALVITPLGASACPTHREVARRLIDEILTMRQVSIEHYAIWSMAAIEADPREYRMTLRALVRSLEKYMQREEGEIHPLVLEAMRAANQRAA